MSAILFDMDGVLIEAKDWHYEALNMALELFGMEIGYAEHLAVYDGLPTRRKLELLSASKGLPKELHEFLNDLKQEWTLKLGYARCAPVFAHQYALQRLKEDNYKLVCCSNSVRGTMEMLLQQARLRQYFDFFLSNEDVIRPKPDPMIYLEAVQRLMLDPKECLVVEDNEHGIAAARDSGCFLMVVQGVRDVNFDNIQSRIAQIEAVCE
jgi:HAD superfamily hydrolase (TIGR01549 family)